MRPFLVLALGLITVSAVFADEEASELKVETVKKVDECSRAAARGDMLTMHYTGTLLSGVQFDSRFVHRSPKAPMSSDAYCLFFIAASLGASHSNFKLGLVK